MRLFKWGYSLTEIKALHAAKIADYVEKREADYKFLIELAKAALGGKGEGGEGYELDDGEGLEEMTAEQEAAMRAALGDDFDRVYSDSEE